MLFGFTPLERSKIERLRRPTLFADNQRLTDALRLDAPFLRVPNQVADRFAVIAIGDGGDLRVDPSILLLSSA